MTINLQLAAFRALLCAILLWGLPAVVAVAQSVGSDQAQTVTHMLDYVSVDYPAAVANGVAISPQEYEEQREFAGQILVMLQQMPAVAGKGELVEGATSLVTRVSAKAEGREVALLARSLAAEVIRAYNVTVSPKQAPDLQRAAGLFNAQCAACHGARGFGDGPSAKALQPAPSNFHDAQRMDKRSIYSLYNTISLGVRGTAMNAFTQLSDADRWALAFLVSGFRTQPGELQSGRKLWEAGQGHEEFRDYRGLVTKSPAEVAANGGPQSTAVRAYLIAQPAALAATASPPLAVSRDRLAQAVKAYRAGDATSARQIAVSAYLEGFELIESQLDNVDAPLRRRMEQEMMSLRSDIDARQPLDAVDARVRTINSLLDAIQEKLSASEMSPAAAFTSSLLILLREGLEAILVLAAIVAVVKKTGRRDALPYVHIGWVGALVAGVATWLLANRLFELSGAAREVTEGVSALFASAMLVYVGLWLHKRSSAQAWQSFIHGQVSGALSKGALWAMAGISFLSVYRELFETILFYEALWAQAGDLRHGALFGGLATGLAMLAVVGWLVLKYSARLPLGVFFSVTSWLLVVMAVVFVGQGVAALQEAGVLSSTAVGFVTVPMLGIHPSLQGLVAQAVMLVTTVLVLLAGRRAGSPATS